MVGDVLREVLLPAVRGQLGDVGLAADAQEHVAEVVLRMDPYRPRGLQQAGEDRSSLAAALGLEERKRPVYPPED